jgi:ABC-2 type transport system permease protein
MKVMVMPQGRPAMWFSSVYLKTLRDFRIAILGWGIGMGLLMYVVLASFPSLVETPQARASLVSLAGTFSWLAEPVAVATPGGYATFKVGFLILIITLWPIIVGSRILRGEEERGSLDALLSLPHGRGRVALEKLAAIWTALLIMGLLIALIAFAAGTHVNASFGLGDALLFGLNLALISGVFGGLALLISQFTQERGAAAGLTGGLLLIFIVLDMVHRVIPNTDVISYFSPIYYFNLSKPLVPSYGTDVGAMLLLLALSAFLNGIAIWLFTQRDVGGVVALPRWLRLPERSVSTERALPVNAWSLHSVYTRSLRMIAVPACWWTLGIVGFAAWMMVVVKQIESQLATIYESSPFLKSLIYRVGGGDAATNATLLSALYTILPLLLMAFAITQVNHWAADEEDGRLELVLSTPQPRLLVVLGRFAALTTAIIIMGLLTLAVTALTSVATGLKLDGDNLAAASLGMIPLGLLVAAIGYLFAGWLRSAVDTGLLSFLLVIWFFISFVGPGLNWSDATLRLSVFYYYGTPLLHGLSLGNMLGVLAVGVVALGLATVRFVRKDIGR